MSDYEKLQQELDSLEKWRYLPQTERMYAIGIDSSKRIHVYSIKSGIKQLSQQKRRQQYYVRITLNGKRTWRSVKKLYSSTWPNERISEPTKTERLACPKKQLILADGEEWGYVLTRGRIFELKQYVVTTSGRVFSLKRGTVTEVSQTIDDKGARVRLYFDGKIERPYVQSLMEDVFGTNRVCDPRIYCGGDRRGLSKKIDDLEHWAHLSIYEDGREKDWYGMREIYVDAYGEKAVLQAEAKKPQYTGAE